MNKSILEGNWNELTGKIKQTWSRLTDDDMGAIKGNVDELVGRVQKAYGHTKEQAWSEFERFKATHLDKTGMNKDVNEKNVAGNDTFAKANRKIS